MTNKSRSWKALVLLAALPVGLLWGAIAIIGSSPNSPEWTRFAIPVVGAATGVACAVVWGFFFFKEKP
jgi:hypothetical protein